jgi:hypothetical protein
MILANMDLGEAPTEYFNATVFVQFTKGRIAGSGIWPIAQIWI